MQTIDGLPKLEDKILTGQQSALVFPYRTGMKDYMDLSDRMLTALGSFEFAKNGSTAMDLVNLEIESIRRAWLNLNEKYDRTFD